MPAESNQAMASALGPVLRPFPTAGSYFLLAVAFIGFAIYGSLVPFDFQQMSAGAAWSQFLDALMTPPSRISRTDFLANILLFVPIGFFLAGGFLVDCLSAGRALAAGAGALVISVAVSAVGEYLQTFSSGRVPSSSDIVAQAIGFCTGFTAWMIAGDALTRWLRATWTARSEDRLSRVLVGYTAIWAFVSLAPFDLTVDVGDLAARFRSGAINLVPFRDHGGPLSLRVWDAVAEVLSAAPLGAAGTLGWTHGRTRSAAGALALGASLIVIVELAQVFVVSHAADVTDVLLGWIGVGAGVTLARTRLVQGRQLADRAAVGASDGRFAIMLLGSLLVVAAYHWQPFNFTIDEDAVRRKLAGMSVVPFAGYLGGSYLNALSNLLTKLGLSVALGVMAAYAAGVGTSRVVVTCVWFVAATGVFAAIECGQLFLPTRTPDPTDVLVGAAGSLVGLSLGRWIRNR